MARMTWDSPGTKRYQTGISRGALYVGNRPGVPWSGLISVNEEPEGGSIRAFYVDGNKYIQRVGKTEYAATIEAFTYPDDFLLCEGIAMDDYGIQYTNQRPAQFGFSYCTIIANDTEGVDHAYQLHLVYDALAEPTSKKSGTLNDQVNASNFTWKIFTKQRRATGFTPTAHIIIDSRFVTEYKMRVLESVLYGSNDVAPRLPSPIEVQNLFGDTAADVFTERFEELF